MIEESLKASIRAGYHRLREATPGSTPRRAQLEMIAAITREMAGVYGDAERPEDYRAPVHVIEGPTGVGKTWGYLLALIPLAKARQKKLVVATATVSLQQQLVERDLPHVRAHSGLDFRAVIAKGRRRYLCPSRLKQRVDEPDPNQSLFGAAEHAPAGRGGDHAALFQALDAAFESGDWDGDRDRWDEPLPEKAWTEVSTDRHGCVGRNCSFFRQCPFFRAREAMDQAELIVANQDLLLADLSLGGGVVLPDPGQTLYVVDECHHLPAKALAHGASQHWVHGAREWLAGAGRKLPQALLALPDGLQRRVDREGDVAGLIDELEAGLRLLAEALDHNGPDRRTARRDEATLRFENGVIPEWLREIGGSIHPPAEKLARRLERIQGLVREALDNGDLAARTAEELMPELGFTAQRAANLAETWELLLRADPADGPPAARWITSAEREGFVDYLVAASPISAGGLLRARLWDTCAGAVLTSATVTALGRFDRFAGLAGLNGRDRTAFLQLQSPFDYARNAVLEVPALGADPADPPAHTRAVTEWLEREIDPAIGSLVLFSSYRQMREVRQDLPQSLKQRIRMQGEMPRGALIAEHRRAVERGEGSILFGVASLAEGVDLPGRLCEHVVIAKIPFPVPDSPVEKTTEEWLKSLGRNPFMEMMVPDAATRLVQAAGRLIRTEDDTGRVSILDPRLLTRAYGRQMLDSLPPMQRRLGGG